MLIKYQLDIKKKSRAYKSHLIINIATVTM